jgi:hypothetical protein
MADNIIIIPQAPPAPIIVVPNDDVEQLYSIPVIVDDSVTSIPVGSPPNVEAIVPGNIPGPTGPPGVSGERGPVGETGASGERGPVGETGASGQPGTPGVSGERGLAGEQGPPAFYTNLNPIVQPLGGIEVGDSFNNLAVSAVLDMLLYPYQYPAFTYFNLDISTPLEVGETIPFGLKNISWGTSNPTNILPNSISVDDTTTGQTLLTGLANTGSMTMMTQAITKNVATNHSWTIYAQNSQSGMISRMFSETWLWGVYYGTQSASGLNSTQINALNKILTGTANRTYSLQPGEYKYICYPTSFGLKSTFKDPSTNLDVAMIAAVTVTVINTFGISNDYYVHRTLNKLGGAINISVS